MQPKIFKSKGLQNRSQQEQPTSTSTTTSLLITQFNFPPHNQKQYPFSLFPVGSEVEVSSDEEGFRDAWYLATVIPPPPSSSLSLSTKQQHLQLFVEYKNLFADENGYALLKEFVDVGFVRPKPPVDVEGKFLFEINDVVDAFFQDGWWTGVVTKVIEKDRDYLYKVFFSNPPEELEFRSSDLRVHRNWIDGKWVRPENERMREVKFSPGTNVEVNTDLDTSPDVWYPATVIKQVDNSFVVEFQSSKEAGHQKVAVDSLHIRPSPPSSSKKGFSLLEKVDAFYDFRWLSGVVTKILADGRYIVYFKRTKKEKELAHADLRLHMEWSNGKWVHSSRDISVTSIPEKQLECAVNGGYKEKLCAPASAHAREERINPVTLKSCQNLLQTPGSEKADNGSTMPRNKRTKQRSANVDSIHLRKRMNEGTSSDAPSYSEIGKLRLKQTDELLNGTSAVLDSSTPGKSGLKQSEVINQSSASIIKMDNAKDSVPRRRGRPPKQRSIELSFLDQETNEDDLFTPGPIVIGLTQNGKMMESLSRISSLPLEGESGKAKKEEEKSSNIEGNRENVVSELQKDGEVTNLKRRRGRPPKSFLRPGSPKAKEADTARTVNEVEPVIVAGTAGISDTNPFSAASRRRRWRILSDHPRGLRAQNSRTGRQVKRGLKSPKEMLSVEFSEPLALRRGRRQGSTKQVQPPAKNRLRTAKVLNNGVTRDVKTVAGTSSNVSDDDRPLSAWFEGAHYPTTDGRASVAGTAGLCDGTGEKHEGSKIELVGQPKNHAQENQGESTAAECVPQDKIQLGGQPNNLAQENHGQGESTAAECVPQDKDASERQDQAPTNSTAIIPVDVYDCELPFVKNSLVWQMIESMEVLKQIPQRPHFRPLYKFKEECREGLAIGNMVTFTSLVDRISRLQFSDPKNVLDGYLDALNDLEDLGFNVLPVRHRLRALISFKERYEHAQNTVIDIETQIMEHDHEKSKIDDEIVELNKKIAEINEKRGLALSKKELRDAEMRLLQSSVDAVKSSLEKAKEEFDKVATSDW